MTCRGWRHERAQRLEQQQWQDAEMLADVRQLLIDIDPARRGASVDPTPGAEDARSGTLKERSNGVETHLRRLAVGHPSAAGQACAGKLAVDVAKATVHSEWHVHDLLTRSMYCSRIRRLDCDLPQRSSQEAPNETADNRPHKCGC